MLRDWNCGPIRGALTLDEMSSGAEGDELWYWTSGVVLLDR